MKQISNFLRGAKVVKDYSCKVTNEPGVYFMYNIDKTILYIGKAKNLNKRISSYSKPSNMSLRIQRMVSQIFSGRISSNSFSDVLSNTSKCGCDISITWIKKSA